MVTSNVTKKPPIRSQGHLKKRLPAGDLVRSLGKIIGGGGGGRPDMAEAGGKNPERLDEALQEAAGEVARRMEAASSN